MLGDRIKTLRNKRGLSQQELANALNVSKSSVAMWETNKREPDTNMLVNIADFFNCSLDYLLGRSDTEIDDSVLDKLNSIDDDLLELYGNIYEAQIAQKARNGQPVVEGALTAQEISHIKKYRTLDGYGKKAVDSVLAVEYERCVSDATDNIAAYRIVPYSVLPASAGPGEWFENNNYEELSIPDLPKFTQADFAVRVHGDSMLPDYEDGDIVLVHRQDSVQVGEIGIFWEESIGGLIKEMGTDSLISHNKDYDDILLKNKRIRCYGRVIAKLEK